MATTNYKFEKRQRDLAKAKKQDEKRAKKLARSGKPAPADETAPAPDKR